MMFWKKKKKLTKNDDLPIITAIKELKTIQTRIGDIAFCVFEGEKDLPEQTKMFYEQLEFAFASYLSCLGIQKRKVLLEYGKTKLQETAKDQKI
jgi:hypothetical protein